MALDGGCDGLQHARSGARAVAVWVTFLKLIPA